MSRQTEDTKCATLHWQTEWTANTRRPDCSARQASRQADGPTDGQQTEQSESLSVLPGPIRLYIQTRKRTKQMRNAKQSKYGHAGKQTDGPCDCSTAAEALNTQPILLPNHVCQLPPALLADLNLVTFDNCSPGSACTQKSMLDCLGLPTAKEKAHTCKPSLWHAMVMLSSFAWKSTSD